MPATLTSRVPEHQPSELSHVADATRLKEYPPNAQKVVIVHSGARDAYQLALALSERGLLSALVTDLFWPLDKPWARAMINRLPAGLRSLLTQRSEGRIPSSEIRLCSLSGLATLLLDKVPRVPLSIRRRMTRYTDAQLGKTAGRLAAKDNAGLVSYSYYGYDAFNYYRRPGILFQLHPHPASMRRILREELAAHPDCASSLMQEWELSLPEQDFQHLVRETKMASSFLVASSFTRRTLVEHGAPAEAIRVVPYGVDSVRFSPDPKRRSSAHSKLQLLFVGRINQRKGIKYLLEALRLLDTTQVELTVCGRVVDGLELFRPFASQVKIRPSVSAADLVAAYQSADLFVFPSVAEGFGQVLLESLACGLPILSTTHTAAPDLIDEGVQGFVVEPRRPDLIAERIVWAMTHRAELTEMGHAARIRAEQFTWERFRIEAAGSIASFLSNTSAATESGRSHV
jgi:glycosyltransferase involved in cell wall biosynthesis